MTYCVGMTLDKGIVMMSDTRTNSGVDNISVFHGAPAAVIISGRLGLPVALEECTRAGQLLDIAANARGVGACWIGSPMLWLHEPATRAELGVPEGWMPYACFALGWPDFDAIAPPPPQRPPLEIDWTGE